MFQFYRNNRNKRFCCFPAARALDDLFQKRGKRANKPVVDRAQAWQTKLVRESTWDRVCVCARLVCVDLYLLEGRHVIPFSVARDGMPKNGASLVSQLQRPVQSWRQKNR